MRETRLLILLTMTIVAFAAAPSRAEEQPERVNKLIAVLKSDAGPHEKSDACRELGVYGTKDAVPALAALLTDEKLATVARTGLEAIPDPAVDDALRNALPQVKGNLLAGVINSLGSRRDTKAVEPLAALLSDADAEVAGAAAASLGKIGTPAAAAALQKALPTAPAGVLPAICEGCLRCAEAALADGKRDDAIALYDRLRAVQVPDHIRIAVMRGAIVARGAAGTALAIEQLKSADAGMFSVALRVAHELPGAELTRALTAELGKLPPEKQVLLLQVLGTRRDAAAVPAVLEAAKTGPDSVRVAAIRALTQIGDASALVALVELATSGTGEVARAAQVSIASFSGKEADAAIASLLNQADAKTRGLAVGLVGLRRVASAVPALLKAAEDNDEAVRTASLRVLGDLAGAAELPAMLGLLVKARSPQETQAGESALSAICVRETDREACADKVAACFASAQGAQKAALLRVLRSVGGAKALAAVRAAGGDANAEIKDPALRILCDWATPDALPDVAQLAKTAADPAVKILALRGYLRLITKQDVPAEKKLASLKEAMALAARSDEKKLALAALGETPHPEAAKLIEACLAEDAVKAEAELALLRISQLMAGSSPDETKAALGRLIASSANANLKKQAQTLLQQLEKSGDYVTAWQVAGPYTEDGKDGFALRNVAFPPEKPDAKDVKWAMMPAGAERGGAMYLDLAAVCGAGDNKAAYVRTWVRSDKEQPARFEFGSDDCDKLWLNGTQIHEDAKGGAATPGKFSVNVTLKQGVNTLLMKVTQVSGPWEFCFRICKPDGGKLEGLKIQATPPAE
ncbi:MAG: HEAT repeat domain-containing protein [Planctomycetota bacterium]|nr:HEAT repeat domain-containing protein [Planctomycetota bacterium]